MRRLRSRRPLVALDARLDRRRRRRGRRASTGTRAERVRYLKSDPDARGVSSAAGNLGGPSSWDAQEIAALAYPSSRLNASQLNNERNYFHGKIKGRSEFHGDRGWQLVGPSTAT